MKPVVLTVAELVMLTESSVKDAVAGATPEVESDHAAEIVGVLVGTMAPFAGEGEEMDGGMVSSVKVDVACGA